MEIKSPLSKVGMTIEEAYQNKTFLSGETCRWNCKVKTKS